MLLLEITNVCNSAYLASILSIVKRILLIIQIAVPLLLAISAIIGFTQLMANPEDKKLLKSIINKFIAAAVVFFIPVFINLVINLVGEGNNFSNCWIHANDKVSSRGSYVDTSINNNNNTKKPIVSSAEDYE